MLNELALFAGAGGGILAGKLLGWRTVCAVECDAYAASVLVARQNDGILAPFPVWDDVRTFDGRPWRGIVDVVSGGFPCQDISCAGKGDGLDGERSGLWKEFARIIGEVRPRYAFVENSPMLTLRGGTRVIGDLAALGYDCRWGIVSAADAGAPHRRERIWIVADAERFRREQGIIGANSRAVAGTAGEEEGGESSFERSAFASVGSGEDVADADGLRRHDARENSRTMGREMREEGGPGHQSPEDALRGSKAGDMADADGAGLEGQRTDTGQPEESESGNGSSLEHANGEGCELFEEGHAGQGEQGGGNEIVEPLPVQVGGSLSPEWVELLMGWVKGWTSLEPLDNMEFHEWLTNWQEDSRRGEILQDMRRETFSENGREPQQLSAPPALQPELRQHEENGGQAGTALEVKEVSSGGVRSLRSESTTSCPSLRREPDEQRVEESPDALCPLPSLPSRYGKEAWQDGSWEVGIARVANNVKNRVDRLRALGNGQVPQCAALAWKILA